MNLKISSGFLKSRRFSVPQTDLRPTEEKIRSAFFNSLFSLINFENRFFLDVFSGSGAIAFEAVSRGFEKACAIEKNPKAVEVICSNADELGIKEKIETMKIDALSPNGFKKIDTVFHAIYIDPPYSFGPEIPDVLNRLINDGLTASVCVIGVESDIEINWSNHGWSSRQKKFGSTFLTIFYNWEKNDEQ